MSKTQYKKVGAPQGNQNARKHAWDCVFFDYPNQSILMNTLYVRLFLERFFRGTKNNSPYFISWR